MKFKSVLCMIFLCIGSMVSAEETQLNRQPVFKQFDTITVACPIGTVPYSYLDDDGQVKGSVIDLWRLWSEKTGIRINFAPASWQAGIDMVCAGKADALALNANLEEQESCLDDVFPVLNDKAYFYWHKSISGLKTILEFSEKSSGHLNANMR